MLNAGRVYKCRAEKSRFYFPYWLEPKVIDRTELQIERSRPNISLDFVHKLGIEIKSNAANEADGTKTALNFCPNSPVTRIRTEMRKLRYVPEIREHQRIISQRYRYRYAQFATP